MSDAYLLGVKRGCVFSFASEMFSSCQRWISTIQLRHRTTLFSHLFSYTSVLFKWAINNGWKEKFGKWPQFKALATECVWYVVTAQGPVRLSEGMASIRHPVKTEVVCVCVCVCVTPGEMLSSVGPRQTQQKDVQLCHLKNQTKTLALPWHPDRTRSLRRLTQIRRKSLIKADRCVRMNRESGRNRVTATVTEQRERERKGVLSLNPQSEACVSVSLLEWGVNCEETDSKRQIKINELKKILLSLSN